VPTWRGLPSEFAELTEAVKHNCTCEVPSIIKPCPPRCPAHQMLDDQAALSHLEFEKTMAGQLLEEEGVDAP
jgi:hypothetical protein